MANLSYISPFFIVGDLRAAVDFYVDRLGFEVRYMGPGEEAFFAIVGREEVSIMLKGNGAEGIPNYRRYAWARWDAYVSTADPDGLYAEFCSRGVVFRQEIKDDEDGLRGFEVEDGDGYVLFFGRPVG